MRLIPALSESELLRVRSGGQISPAPPASDFPETQCCSYEHCQAGKCPGVHEMKRPRDGKERYGNAGPSQSRERAQQTHHS